MTVLQMSLFYLELVDLCQLLVDADVDVDVSSALNLYATSTVFLHREQLASPLDQ